MSQRIRGYADKNNDDINAISPIPALLYHFIYCAIKFLERKRKRKREPRLFDSRVNILNVIENNTLPTESEI